MPVSSPASELWLALSQATRAQTDAIHENDADALDALIAQKGQIIDALSKRDIQADTAADPALLALIQTAQQQEAMAEAALAQAQKQLGEKLHALRKRRAARRAFDAGTEVRRADTTVPRFCDQHV